MPTHPIYSDFMYVIQNTPTIRDTYSNYKVYYRIIKNLPTDFESYQNIRTTKENKTLVESINHIQINRWAKDRLYVKHGNQSYTDWKLMTAYGVMVLLNTPYEYLKSEYGIPRSTMTSHPINIFHPMQYINSKKFKKKTKTGKV